MHPAPSVIVFTSISGLGFGYFIWLGLGIPDLYGWEAFAAFFVAYAFSVGGLLASVFHLANKKNAIYSFSQWKTSWLSREGILSVLALLAFAVFAIGRIFFATALPVFGYLGAALALLTVFSTSMIYTQLKTVPRWNMPINPVLFLLYSVAGGALLSMQPKVAGVLIVLLTALQVAGWMMGDKRLAESGSTKGTATGLNTIGQVRLFESAHTSRNYILDEMVHMVGRKHAQKLRMISIVALGAVPAALLLLLPPNLIVTLVALASHVIGVFASRWLFFAEAEHVVGLYYNRD
ncbi:DmsC/YnfH family molybdoenzyme membrane anchor subunit [Maritimibacter sp. HL-12]|uniref:dimethyl sulfoxide reductase anchor subunit family protein n=1 Tax=Maritimibacter sp. HL-12 TaxID=1162418 RepID=UPI000A0F331B|nr:DmsC/YnfH family molybdoenzyme membrane anchor subunit [Maritimibacter sp. HL-12]SMH43910.1 DMSO reductase anchor subunit [Maritimibacter sp. HL-12]